MLAARERNAGDGGLPARLKARIEQAGSLTVAQYMEACLSDPQFGYYATRDPFGAGGDFITAPEISQMFGELIGLWAAVTWRHMGSPKALRLVELGPGRGTLMADALRAARAAPECLNALEVHLVETSARLREVQRETLGEAGADAHWHAALDAVPEGPAIIVANEFIDALPVRQFERDGGAWYERLVGLGQDGALAFERSRTPLGNTALIPQAVSDAGDGQVAEIRPGADAIVESLARRAEAHPTAALVVDYGHDASAPGETLQAVAGHDYANPLREPGAVDLTAHVDFGALADTARRNGLAVHGPLPQGVFLLSLGLEERCKRLMENAAGRDRELIASAARRLADPEQMGELFRVMALTSPDLTPPPFDAAGEAPA